MTMVHQMLWPRLLTHHGRTATRSSPCQRRRRPGISSCASPAAPDVSTTATADGRVRHHSFKGPSTIKRVCLVAGTETWKRPAGSRMRSLREACAGRVPPCLPRTGRRLWRPGILSRCGDWHSFRCSADYARNRWRRAGRDGGGALYAAGSVRQAFTRRGRQADEPRHCDGLSLDPWLRSTSCPQLG